MLHNNNNTFFQSEIDINLNKPDCDYIEQNFNILIVDDHDSHINNMKTAINTTIHYYGNLNEEGVLNLSKEVTKNIKDKVEQERQQQAKQFIFQSYAQTAAQLLDLDKKGKLKIITTMAASEESKSKLLEKAYNGTCFELAAGLIKENDFAIAFLDNDISSTPYEGSLLVKPLQDKGVLVTSHTSDDNFTSISEDGSFTKTKGKVGELPNADFHVAKSYIEPFMKLGKASITMTRAKQGGDVMQALHSAYRAYQLKLETNAKNAEELNLLAATKLSLNK